MNLAEWLEAAAESARDIGAGALGVSETRWSGPSGEKLPGNLCGIYIPLLSEGLALQLGVLATREVCGTLARRLLGEPEDGAEMVSDSDVFDAVGEVTNLIAGNVKVLLADRVQLRVGVPLALKGRVFPLGSSQSVHGQVMLDDSSVWLVLTGTRSS